MWQVIYGNYFPREVESIWETEEEAEARCEVLEKEQYAKGLGLGMWVTEEVHVSEKPKGIAVLINGDEHTSINMADLAVGDPIVDVDSRPKIGFTGIEYTFDEAVPPNTFMVIDKPAAITPKPKISDTEDSRIAEIENCLMRWAASDRDDDSAETLHEIARILGKGRHLAAPSTTSFGRLSQECHKTDA